MHYGNRPHPQIVAPGTFSSDEQPGKPDIVFTTPRFTGGKVSKPGYVTVLLNGVLTQDHTELLGPTVHHALPTWVAHDPDMPVKLQDHSMPVRFRNIWIRPLVPANRLDSTLSRGASTHQ